MAVMSHTHGSTGASVSTASGQTEGAADTTKYALVLTANNYNLRLKHDSLTHSYVSSFWRSFKHSYPRLQSHMYSTTHVSPY